MPQIIANYKTKLGGDFAALGYTEIMRTGKLLKILLGFMYAVVLASCASSPGPDTASPAPIRAEVRASTEDRRVASLLEQARISSSPEAEQYFLEAALQLVDLNRKGEAIDILNALDTDNLELSLTTEILIEKAKLYILANQAKLALRVLDSPRLLVLPQLSDTQQIAIRLTRAQAYFESDDYLASARERIYVNKLLPENKLAENHEKIWIDLTSLPAELLQELATNEINFEVQGWYELGVIGKAYQYNLDRQVVELEKWRQSKTHHPASRHLPQTLLLIESMARERPDRIALLLPLNTSAGKIVRDGFMSAHFNVQEIGGKVPLLRLYDTSKSDDILSLYRQAVNEGAGMVIGPLLKQNVADLQQSGDLSVRTLALNKVDDIDSDTRFESRSKTNLLYQFALSPENEAQQIALKAWEDGHRYVAILSPQDKSANDSLTRKKNSFIKEWQALGGEVIAQEMFIDDYTNTIETLLDLSDSEYRKEILSRLIGESLEFTQRRRQDVDCIFLIAPSGIARQINPRLAYLYAGDIPVYASQDIYSGTYRPLEDVDLNGILFGDSPWLLSDSDYLKLEIQSLFPQTTARNLRLQAFGIDAFRLYPRLKQLETVPDTRIFGATGLLTLDDQQNIIRELSWAKIEEGQAKPLNPNE